MLNVYCIFACCAYGLKTSSSSMTASSHHSETSPSTTTSMASPEANRSGDVEVNVEEVNLPTDLVEEDGENENDNDDDHHQHNDEKPPEHLSTRRNNPLLRHQRRNAQYEQDTGDQCHVWSSRHSPEDLCSRGRWSRLRQMRQLSLFNRDCDVASANVRLGELFLLEWPAIKSEADLLVHTEQLRPGAEGRDCVLGAPHSNRCRACFERLAIGLEQVERAYAAFDRTLQRFDCLLAIDSASATRPFSPNGTCLDCKIWYRKWVLVQMMTVWRSPACVNWCYYTQLACPHFGTSKVVDFAGHPAFLCRDLNIPQLHNTGTIQQHHHQKHQQQQQQLSFTSLSSIVDHENAYNEDTCHCVHPCDLQRPLRAPPDAAEREWRRSTGQNAEDVEYDFYASPTHCWRRRQRCRRRLGFYDNQDERKAAAVRQPRINEHDDEDNVSSGDVVAVMVDDVDTVAERQKQPMRSHRLRSERQ